MQIIVCVEREMVFLVHVGQELPNVGVGDIVGEPDRSDFGGGCHGVVRTVMAYFGGDEGTKEAKSTLKTD